MFFLLLAHHEWLRANTHTLFSLVLDGMGAFERQYFNLKAFTGSRDDNFYPARSPLSPGPHTLAITTHIHTLARSRAIIQRHKLSLWVYGAWKRLEKRSQAQKFAASVKNRQPLAPTPQRSSAAELIKRVWGDLLGEHFVTLNCWRAGRGWRHPGLKCQKYPSKASS